MQRHHQYLIFAQLIILGGLSVVSFGAQGLEFITQYVPLIVTMSLFIVSMRLCVKIMRLVDPDYAKRRAGHMHGSMLPRHVFEPEY